MRYLFLLFLLLLLVGCASEAKVIDEVETNNVVNDIQCPSGMYNDPAPGACGQFVDNDGNRICDLSE